MPTELKQFDQKRMVVELTMQGEKRLLPGVATYSVDPTIGKCLRIALDDPASGPLEILLSEQNWSGEIVPDTTHGAEYLVRLTQVNCPC
jgi:hypothetical protein